MTDEEFAAMAREKLGDKCYVVRGTLSDGSPFLSRKLVCEHGFASMDAAKEAAEQDVVRMNGLGASVTAIKQTLSADGLKWNDS